AVLGADFHRARALHHAIRVERAALHGRLVGGDHALHAGDHADARDDAGAEPELGPPRGQRRELEKWGIAIEQQFDALARHQLAALQVARDVFLAATSPHQRQLLVEIVELREEALPIGAIRLGADVGVAAQDLHQWLASGGYNATPSDAGQA